MKTILIAAAVAGALALPGLASAADISGAWKVVVSASDMTFHTDCALKQTGATLSGTCVGTDAPPDGGAAPKPATVTGGVDGSNVKFGYDVSFGDMNMHIDYTGALKSDTAMDGKFEVSGFDGTFTATKN
jgi:hypothetical protein